MVKVFENLLCFGERKQNYHMYCHILCFFTLFIFLFAVLSFQSVIGMLLDLSFYDFLIEKSITKMQ